MSSNVQSLSLESTVIGDVTVLAAVQTSHEPRQVTIYFAKGVQEDRVKIASPWITVSSQTVDSALKIICTCDTNDDLYLIVDRIPTAIKITEPNFALMRNKNVALSVRNGETAEIVADWLEYHHTTQKLDGAVILSRGKPRAIDTFSLKLRRELDNRGLALTIANIVTQVPMGDPDLPAEWHPYCVPGAPGKDRMSVPGPAPWVSPFQEVNFYEIARWWLLQTARAVANIDVYDLIFADGKGSIFDRAAEAPTGLISLLGRHCYPWRVRKKEHAAFGDHICIQFDKGISRRRWCIAPQIANKDSVWKFIRIPGVEASLANYGQFGRYMAIRHRVEKVSKLVPKTSLVEHPVLIDFSKKYFDHRPVRMPQVDRPKTPDGSKGKTSIVTTMKNEGPFILEWIAYHRVIGVDGFLVYTNDCTDGTDTLLDVLQDKGIVQHRDNPFKGTDLKPQHAALQAAENEPLIQNAEWAICMDVDEFLNIKVGDGTLRTLYEAVGDANMISCTWRLFGNANVHEFNPAPIIGQFDTCAPELIRKPHQAWGFKTLFKNLGLFKKLGVHRPKGLIPQLWDHVQWVNGSGKDLPRDMFRNAWRSTTETYGYDLVQLNHYAVRSAESFLVKRDRGRVNHVDRDQGLAYWFRMNNNTEKETSIQRMLPALHAEIDRLLQDPDIKQAHEFCINAHRAKIDELKAGSNYAAFYEQLTSERMERLSTLHKHFGANVFLSGPDCVPEDVVFGKLAPDYFFTVEKGDTVHS